MSSYRIPRQFVQLALSTADLNSGKDRRSPAGSDFEWEALFQLAQEIRMVPLLLSAMKSQFPEVYQSPLLSSARGDLASFERKSAGVLSAHFKTLRSLSNAGITALNFKGPFLAQVAYGNCLGRQFDDLDIIVPPYQYNQALAHLQNLSFQIVAVAHWQTLLSATLEDFTLRIDLHRHWMPPHLPEPVRTQAIWDRAQFVELHGRKFLTLSHADSLLTSSMYFVKEWHNQAPCLRYAIDVAMLAAQQRQSDWSHSRNLAEGHEMGAALRLAMTAACGLLDRDCAYLWEDVADRRLKALADKLDSAADLRGPIHPRTLLSAYSPHAICVRRALSLGTWDWLVRELRSAGIRLFFVKSEDRQWVSLPAALNLLYVVIRPVHIGIQVYKAFLVRLRSNKQGRLP